MGRRERLGPRRHAERARLRSPDPPEGAALQALVLILRRALIGGAFAACALIACKRREPAPLPSPPSPSSTPSSPSNDADEADVPQPETLKRIDEAQHGINAVILVVGNGAERTIQTIGTRVDAGGIASRGAMTYLGLSLGEIRGWKPLLHLYAYPERTTEEAKKHLARADGLIVVEYAEGKSAPFVDVLARPSRASSPLRTEPIAIGVMGSPPFATSWTNAGGRTPERVSPADDAEVFPTLKAVAKAILNGLKKNEQ